MRQSIIQSPNYKWWVFTVVAISTFMTVANELGVMVALPSIEGHFDADLPTVQWVVVGYALAISILLLPMGRLADIIGRGQVYIAGFITFVLGAVLAGFSTGIIMLIMANILLGAGGAMLVGNGIALMTSVFPERERGKALGFYLSMVGLGAIVGPALGGFLVTALTWRAVFLIAVPTGVIGTIAALIILDRRSLSQDTQGGLRPKFDWFGAVMSAGALLAFLLAMTYGSRLGWGSAPIVGGLLASVFLLAAFIWWELHTSSPMLDLTLFKRRLVALGVMSGWIAFMALYGLLFMMPFYLQNVLGYPPEQAGLMVIPAFVCMTILGPVSGRLSDRIGWRKLTMGGLAMIAVALFVLSTKLTETSSIALVIPLLMLLMAGDGMFESPNNNSILSAVERYRYGVASALTQLMRTSASVTTVALSTAIVVATMASMGFEPKLEAVSVEGGTEMAHAFVAGLHRVFMVLGGLMVIGVVLCFLKSEKVRESLAPSPQPRVSEGPSD
jgi:EmrB/QacA subfamily drug resistance transporter